MPKPTLKPTFSLMIYTALKDSLRGNLLRDDKSLEKLHIIETKMYGMVAKSTHLLYTISVEGRSVL